ncbi:MAG: helix-turn-helix domain-containing protein [Psychrilyobacter sp.]|uniref:helix-turn-helix domain-containing protein n=1 Tax=Psychrilyobacter sp. TaxID=2586924 RepID=UPI003C713470
MNYGQKKIIETQQEFFTTDSFANILGVAPCTVRRYIRDGLLTGIKISGVYLIFLSDALNYINKFN